MAKNTGKSTAARIELARLGTPRFFVREFTVARTSILSSRKTFPTVFDNPNDLFKVKSFIDNSFNAEPRPTDPDDLFKSFIDNSFNAEPRPTSRSVTVSSQLGLSL